jgi:hypothetical protein
MARHAAVAENLRAAGVAFEAPDAEHHGGKQLVSAAPGAHVVATTSDADSVSEPVVATTCTVTEHALGTIVTMSPLFASPVSICATSHRSSSQVIDVSWKARGIPGPEHEEPAHVSVHVPGPVWVIETVKGAGWPIG